MTKLGSAMLAAALVLVLPACSGNDEGDRALPSTTSTSSASSPDEPECVPPERNIERSDLDAIVKVFVFCRGASPPEDSVSVTRVVPADGAPLRAALNQLLIGLTPQESDAGFVSAFSSYTVGGLRGVTVENGIATIDFTEGWESTNNFGTSHLSGMVASQIQATAFQFPEVNGIELQIEGERWCGWESTCDGQSVPLWPNPASCTFTSDVTERSAGQTITVGRETSRFSICLDPGAHPLADLNTEGCPFSYASNYSINGPGNYPIGFQVTEAGSCTVTNGDFQVTIVSTE